ncbi:hypothetical protein F4818DRAFT_284487 [Hypoxylon cercidicola]|nr:hypothetical protein F4818DRAFT_284487 [Hypoxylon cercidicola]
MTTSKGIYSLWLLQYWKFVLFAILLISSAILFFESYWQVQSPDSQGISLGSFEKLEGADKVDDDTTITTPNTTISTNPANLTANLPPKDGTTNLTVNLVMATLLNDDISWTENIQIPNLNIIRYVSDDMDAEYHPPVPRKGHEALIYHTYMHDFYDNLPDITIFTHGDDTSWHVDAALNSSMAFSLSHLDLEQVMLRQYFNLRVDWVGGCPDWINTTRGVNDASKTEEPYMYKAFRENFNTAQVPEILAGPCCSQFAATRNAIRRHPRSQYRSNMDWLILTDWTDYISGRVWEHMWAWLFMGEAVDCAVEWRSYCRMYHICFGAESRNRFRSLEQERKRLEGNMILGGLIDWLGGQKTQGRLDEIDAMMAAELENAIEIGKTEATRTNVLSDLYKS